MQIISRRATATTSYDTDAAAWFTAVEAADGQVLPTAYKTAWNTFITGLKGNNYWSLIRQIIPLCSAASLTGALIPVVGPTPLNNGTAAFTSSDYDRKTGLLGKANAQIDTAIVQNDSFMPQNDIFNAFHSSVISATAAPILGSTSTSTGATRIFSNGTNTVSRSNGSQNTVATQTGFNMLYRNNSANYVLRTGGANNTYAVASQSPSTNTTNFIWYRFPSSYGTGHRLRLLITGRFGSIDPVAFQSLCDTLITAIVAA